MVERKIGYTVVMQKLFEDIKKVMRLMNLILQKYIHIREKINKILLIDL
jgi:hypothetical protein